MILMTSYTSSNAAMNSNDKRDLRKAPACPAVLVFHAERGAELISSRVWTTDSNRAENVVRAVCRADHLVLNKLVSFRTLRSSATTSAITA